MALPDYEAWAIFAAVARLGSFTAAAQELALSKPTISKAISRLEESLGTVLFHRTSRRISLSTAGKALLPHARQIAMDGEAAMEAARDTTHLLQGQVRLAAPLSYGLSHLAPVIADFMCAYPEITVDLQLNDARVDLVEEGFDCAIRIGALPDSSLRAIKLRRMNGYFIAAPSYVERKGQPATPADLNDHDCFIYSNTPSPEIWQITGPDDQTTHIRPKCRFRSNNGDVMLPAGADSRTRNRIFARFSVSKGTGCRRADRYSSGFSHRGYRPQYRHAPFPLAAGPGGCPGGFSEGQFALTEESTVLLSYTARI